MKYFPWTIIPLWNGLPPTMIVGKTTEFKVFDFFYYRPEHIYEWCLIAFLIASLHFCYWILNLAAHLSDIIIKHDWIIVRKKERKKLIIISVYQPCIVYITYLNTRWSKHVLHEYLLFGFFSSLLIIVKTENVKWPCCLLSQSSTTRPWCSRALTYR